MERIETEYLCAKAILQVTPPMGHLALPDVCCDIYCWNGRLQFAGPMTRADAVPFAGHATTILCIDPLVAQAWLWIPLCEVADRIIDLMDMDKRCANEIAGLFEQGGVGEIARRAPPGAGNHGRLAFAARALRGGERIDAVADKVNLSQRQLERLFSHHLGLPPKRFASILRFRRAIMGAKRGLSLSDSAHSAGYADQAHL